MNKETRKIWIAISSSKNSDLMYSRVFKTKKEAEIELKKYGWKIIRAEITFKS